MTTIEVLQVPSELEWLLARYRKLKPRRVLEIGSWQGGTLREWLKTRPELVVCVDLDHQREDLYRRWRKRETVLHVITGNSQDVAIQAQVRKLGPYDWLFVDGDHGEKGVRSDVALAIECAAPQATLVLHDIARGIFNEGDIAPALVFAELGERYETTSNVEDNAIGGHHWAHGIGVVQL